MVEERIDICDSIESLQIYFYLFKNNTDGSFTDEMNQILKWFKNSVALLWT